MGQICSSFESKRREITDRKRLVNWVFEPHLLRCGNVSVMSRIFAFKSIFGCAFVMTCRKELIICSSWVYSNYRQETISRSLHLRERLRCPQNEYPIKEEHASFPFAGKSDLKINLYSEKGWLNELIYRCRILVMCFHQPYPASKPTVA